jgi:glycosyltransferase involved in cell wall biosynthesis
MNQGGQQTGGTPRVAVVTHGFLPLTGGSETHHALAADRLAAQASVRVYTSSLCLERETPRQVRRTSREVQVERAAVHTDYLPSVWVLNEKFILPLALLAEIGSFRPTTIWTNHPSASSIAAGLFARLTGCRWIATYHANLEESHPIRRGFMWLEFRLLRQADVVEVSTSAQRDILLRRGIPPERIQVVPPFTWAARIPTSARSGEFSWTSPPSGEHPLLFVGGLDAGHDYKKPDHLLQALADLKAEGTDAAAVVVGEGPRLQPLKDLAERLGISDKLSLPGKVSDAELVKLYRRAWCLVVPSVGPSEGYGLVVLEALSNGCPVVASTDVPAAREVGPSRGVLTYQSGDITELVQVLRGLCTDSLARAVLAEQTQRLDLRAENDRHIWTLCGLILGTRPHVAPAGPAA